MYFVIGERIRSESVSNLDVVSISGFKGNRNRFALSFSDIPAAEGFFFIRFLSGGFLFLSVESIFHCFLLPSIIYKIHENLDLGQYMVAIHAQTRID